MDIKDTKKRVCPSNTGAQYEMSIVCANDRHFGFPIPNISSPDSGFFFGTHIIEIQMEEDRIVN